MVIENGNNYPVFKKNNLIIRKNVTIGFRNRRSKIIINTPCYIENDCVLEIGEVGEGVIFENNCVLRHVSKVGSYTTFKQGVKVIDEYLPFGTNSEIIRYESWFSEKFSIEDSFKSKNIVIGKCVWCGNNVRILRGITIGDGAIIAADSVVVEDVPPYTIVAGNPARKIDIVSERKICSSTPSFEGEKAQLCFRAETGEIEINNEVILKLKSV